MYDITTHLRILRPGSVSALRSQSLYHAVAQAARDGDAPTLIVLSPGWRRP
ncbi:MAG: hypothetical protein QF415_09995 [Candidatus Undinarchaeales archaeon]|nr:hypothetical protein [Candidatus Undinarchaeales archaeon]MDP7491531.1 hypothetical protein [Candidatus Undinarchaeales archaeon]